MKMTKDSLLKVIGAADEVISALADTNDEVHKDDTDKMVRLWDGLNDKYAPPEVVRELARMALGAMDSEPVYQCEFTHAADSGELQWHWEDVNEAFYEQYDSGPRGRRRILYSAPQPGPVAGSQPVAYTDERNLGYIDRGRETAYLWGKQNSEDSDFALYRHAQPGKVVDRESVAESVTCWSCRNEVEISAIGDCDGYCPKCDAPIDLDEEPYTSPQPAPDREQVRSEHAEWSQATFGNVGPVGPLKHLRREVLEAIAKPHDLIEWADMQFLLWDAQRRASITDEQITQSMIEKLAINKARQWPAPKDGEPRLHIKGGDR